MATRRRAMIEVAATAAHEVNRAYCRGIGDPVAPRWSAAPSWMQESVIDGVRGVMNGNDAEMSHEQWLARREADGWKYGPVKDEEKKEHPCMVPFDQLPAAQQQKDRNFVETVREILLLDTEEQT